MLQLRHPVLGTPIDVRRSFGPERDRLIQALDGLDDAAWRTPTPCPGWSVHDIAVHVLGDDIGRLSRTRDDFVGTGPSDGEAFAQFIDRLNDEWVVAARRMSPRLLQAALAWTGEQIAELWRQLPPDAMGDPVSWAGPDPAPIWLDAARDFTEYWVHRQQLREALGHSTPEDAGILHVVIDTFMRALPHTLRGEQRSTGDRFSFVVPGPAGGTWTLERHRDGWRLVDAAPSSNSVVLDAEHVWRLCVRMIQPSVAKHRADVSGDPGLADAALTMVSIIRAD